MRGNRPSASEALKAFKEDTAFQRQDVRTNLGDSAARLTSNKDMPLRLSRSPAKKNCGRS
jgi:hypothetical protein